MNDDPTISAKDYSLRKSHSSFNPYSEIGHFASLRYEDEARLRASMVIERYQFVLGEIRKQRKSLSIADKQRLA